MFAIWKPVPDYGGVYAVSRFGYVKNIKTGRMLKSSCHSGAWVSYLRVTLYEGRKRKSFLVHRLVLTAWVGPAEGRLEGRHLDLNSYNNDVMNLAWGTARQNKLDFLYGQMQGETLF